MVRYVTVYILFALPWQIESFKAETTIELESFTIKTIIALIKNFRFFFG